jgi:uncharacterized membrane protein SirB2
MGDRRSVKPGRRNIMFDDLSNKEKEQAEQYVFARNMAQKKAFNTFNLYAIAITGFVFAAIEYFAGHNDGTMISEVLAFVQAAFAIAGVLFAVWSSETKEHAVQNTFLTQTGLLLEVTWLVLGLVMFAAHMTSPKTPVGAYLVPWLFYALCFFIVLYIIRGRAAGKYAGRQAKTRPFGLTMIVIVIIIFAVRALGYWGLNELSASLSESSSGYSVVLAGIFLGAILGSLTAVNFYKNLLVKKYDIDLSRLYEGGEGERL